MRFRPEYLEWRFRDHISRITETKPVFVTTMYKVVNGELLIYDPPTRTAQKTFPLLCTVANPTILQVSDSLYFLSGGLTRKGVSNQAYKLDANYGKITPLAEMLVPRRYHGLAAIHLQSFCIFAVGGSGRVNLKSCEKFDELRNRWIYSAPLSEARRSVITMVRAERYVYVFGGHGSDPAEYSGRRFEKIERLDAAEEEGGWQPIEINADPGLMHEFWRRYTAPIQFHPINSHDILMLKGQTFLYNATESTMASFSVKCKMLNRCELSASRHGYIYFLSSETGDQAIYSHYTKKFIIKKAPVIWAPGDEAGEGDGEDDA